MLETLGIVCSMNRRGNCYDAVTKSFFSIVKSEPADRFESFGGARWTDSTTSRCSHQLGNHRIGIDRHGARLYHTGLGCSRWPWTTSFPMRR